MSLPTDTNTRFAALALLALRRQVFRYTGTAHIGTALVLVEIVEVRTDGRVRCRVLPDGDDKWVFDPSELSPLVPDTPLSTFRQT